VTHTSFQAPETATIVFVDVVESVRHVQRDEASSIQRMRALMQHAANLVVHHQGKVIERLGDGLVLRFDAVPAAVQCARALHQLAEDEGAPRPEVERLQLRVGVHCAPIWSDASGLYGMGVSLTARVAAMGGPGDTVLTAAARDRMVAGLDLDLQDLGMCYLKHVDEPQRLCRIRPARPMSKALAHAIAARMKTRPTLAVLPFVMEEKLHRGPVALGISDIIRHQLTAQFSLTPMLHVISALSAAAFRQGEASVSTLYKTLGADYLLKGRVCRSQGGSIGNERLGVAAELWRQGSDEPIWADVIQSKTKDVLSAQSELIGGMVQIVSHRILAVEQRLWRVGQSLPNLASHTLYLGAVDLLHRFSLADFDRARLMLLALAERAPRHPDPPAWLARWHVFRVVQGWTDDSMRDSAEALSYSERALDRDPQSALALTMAGSVHAGVKRDPAKAQGFYEQALAVDPNDSMAWVMSGVSSGFLHRPEESLSAGEMGLGLAPLDPLRFYYESLAATSAVYARDYMRAIELADRAISGNRGHGSSYRAKAIAQAMSGDAASASHTISALLAVEPGSSLRQFWDRVGPKNEQKAEYARALAEAGLPAD
jgi:adenylate cyclase